MTYVELALFRVSQSLFPQECVLSSSSPPPARLPQPPCAHCPDLSGPWRSHHAGLALLLEEAPGWAWLIVGAQKGPSVPVRVGPWRPGLGLGPAADPCVWPWALSRWLSTFCAQSWERRLRTMQATSQLSSGLRPEAEGLTGAWVGSDFTPFFSVALSQRETLGPWGN